MTASRRPRRFGHFLKTLPPLLGDATWVESKRSLLEMRFNALPLHGVPQRRQPYAVVRQNWRARARTSRPGIMPDALSGARKAQSATSTLKRIACRRTIAARYA